MGRLSINKAGLAFGVLLGAWHAMWALLVALGVAQAVVDFVFWIHFLKLPIVVESFALSRALILVAVTAALGYVLGACFALLWNWMHSRVAA